MDSFHLEICVDSADSALAASQAGATRLELCSNLIIGGTTPPTSLMELARELTDLPIHVLIRPRFGDFLFTPFEFEQMKRDVISCRNHMMDGIVIGATTADGKLDTYMLSSLIELAGDMHITLHRAFDVCKDPFKTLEDAISLGIHTILTSGQEASAPEGSELLAQLIEKVNGRIDIMPGAGITSATLSDLAHKTNAKSFHLSAKELSTSLMTYHNPRVSMGLPGINESVVFNICEEEIINARRILEAL